jgi:hypothetical protein
MDPLRTAMGLAAQPRGRRGSRLKKTQPRAWGLPLPKRDRRVVSEGQIRGRQFVGEDRSIHTPKDESSACVWVMRSTWSPSASQTDYKDDQPTPSSKTAWVLSLRNRKDEDVIVAVREDGMISEWS